MTTINIQRKYSTATIECSKGYIRFHDGQIADAYEALRDEYMNDVRHWKDESLVEQHWDIVRCVRDIGRNARVLINKHGRAVFSGIIINDVIPAKEPMDNKTFHQREAITATVRSIVIDLADACEMMYQRGYSLAYTRAKRDDMATLRAFNAALLTGGYDSPATNAGIDVLVIRGASQEFMKDIYRFLGLDTAPDDSVAWNDDLSIAANIKASIS